MRNEKLRIDVFLNDDGSTDGTSEAVQEWYKKNSPLLTSTFRLHLLRGFGHDYWARGMERAWKAAGEDYNYFLWLNDDVVLKPDAIRSLLDDESRIAVTTGAAACVVVGACSTDVSEKKSSYSATTVLDKQLFPNGTPQLADGWFNGNCVLVPRRVYENVGMIDGAYSHARADYDYAERLKRNQVPFYCSSHFVGVCVKDWSERMAGKRLGARLAMLFRPSHCNLVDMWRYRVRYYGVWRAMVSCLHLILIQIKG